MKTLSVVFTTIVSLIVSGLTWVPDLTMAGRHTDQASEPTPAIVRIEHRWQSQTEGGFVRWQADSLGTAISPNVILTHNHFSGPLGELRNETLTFIEADGESMNFSAADLVFVSINPGTLLIYLPANVNLTSARAADAETTAKVVVGAQLTVSFWDDAAGRFAKQSVRVVKVENGVATVADPRRLSNRGDSGGGVYFENRLIGNTWSMNVSGDVYCGTFNVALMPADVVGLTLPGAQFTDMDSPIAEATSEEGTVR